MIVAVVMMTMLAVIGKYVPPVVLPIVVIGGLLAIGIIGALQLRNDGELTQKNFLTLILETYKRLLLLRGNESRNK